MIDPDYSFLSNEVKRHQKAIEILRDEFASLHNKYAELESLLQRFINIMKSIDNDKFSDGYKETSEETTHKNS